MRTVIIVHPGSVYVSYACEAPAEMFANVEADMLEQMSFCDNLIVIDGSLSEDAPSSFNRSVAAAIADVTARGGIAMRVWGCDSGEPPYPGWPGDETHVYGGQVEAATRLAGMLDQSEDIVITGAWARRDGTSGCVTSVHDAISHLHDGMDTFVSVSENAAFEEDVLDPEPEMG